MKLIRVAAAVLNQTPLDGEGNRDHVKAAIEAARQRGVSVLCLPELCLCGYGCEDAFHSPGVQRIAQEMLLEIVPHTRGMIVSLGLPVLHRGGLFNTACLAADGKILGFVAKQNLANDGIHYEPRWFKPWPAGVRVETSCGDDDYPLGDFVANCGDVLLGFEICEDAWVGNRPGADLARRDVDLILNPSASHFAFGKHEVRRRFVLEGSRAFHVTYLYANLLGNESGRAIYDGDAMIASGGRMLAVGSRFSYEPFQLTVADADVDVTRMSRARTGSFRVDVRRRDDSFVETPFTFPQIQPQESSTAYADWETAGHRKEEEFTRATSLGLFDYLRKSRSQGWVVSLSGGADSAAVATLCANSLKMACQDIGEAGVRERLSYVSDWPQTEGMSEQEKLAAITQRLLVCAYQATRNSSETTRLAAEQTAAALDARFYHFDVDEIVQQYIGEVSNAIGRPLEWSRDDIALQNIQARVRAPSVWMLANIFNALLLATSNRSEAAVGYATMDGDTCGGLSPIAGIDKAFLREWLRWMEQHGPQGLEAIPALIAINQQEPTAELRPSAAKQTDEDDLMPYEILDEIERAAIRDKLTPKEVFQRLRPRFAECSREQLAIWVRRFFLLWSRNQWKRERYAPSFHLDDENLDPKTWCRFPILSGGFHRELEELDAFVKTLTDE